MALPGELTRDKHSTVWVPHSYGVAGVVWRRAQVKSLLCFCLRLLSPLNLAVVRLEEG